MAAYWSLRTIEHRVVANRPNVSIPADTIPDVGPSLRSRRVAVDAAGPSPARQRASCRVTVTGDHPQQKLFLAIFDGESGAVLAARAIVDPLPLVLTFESIPIGRHSVRIAREQHRTKSSYVAIAPVRIAVGEMGDIEISCATRALRIQLAASQDNADHPVSIAGIPVILRRQDDPNWRYHHPTSTVAQTDAKGAAAFFDLGAGGYVLTMPGFEPDEAERGRLMFQRDEFDQIRPIRGRPR